MMRDPQRGAALAAAIVAALVAAVLGAVVVVVIRAGGLPDGPVPVIWDREPCAFCRMHVGEPAFAAQLQTTDGEVHAYDDPGCLFLHIERDDPPVHALWFRHMREERWVSGEEVGFVSTQPTPMGFGIGAVDGGAPGAFGLDAARRVVVDGDDPPAADEGG